MAGMRICEP